MFATTSIYISFSFYKSSDNTQFTSLNNFNTSTGTSTVDNNPGSLQFGCSQYSAYSIANQPCTVYKSLSVKQSLDNQSYLPPYYYGDNYYDYSSEDDNSTSINRTNIDNSRGYNSDLYQELCDTYYNYYDNGYYDTSNSNNNTTTVINNYYSSNVPDNPDNPDDPTNPVLDEILAALFRFFNAIGEIIGTIFAGLLNMINSVLESIAGIMEDLTGVTDFFGALVSWLPEPIPTVIGIGVSICILLAIIGFFRG